MFHFNNGLRDSSTHTHIHIHEQRLQTNITPLRAGRGGGRGANCPWRWLVEALTFGGLVLTPPPRVRVPPWRLRWSGLCGRGRGPRAAPTKGSTGVRCDESRTSKRFEFRFHKQKNPGTTTGSHQKQHIILKISICMNWPFTIKCKNSNKPEEDAVMESRCGLVMWPGRRVHDEPTTGSNMSRYKQIWNHWIWVVSLLNWMWIISIECVLNFNCTIMTLNWLYMKLIISQTSALRTFTFSSYSCNSTVTSVTLKLNWMWKCLYIHNVFHWNDSN